MGFSTIVAAAIIIFAGIFYAYQLATVMENSYDGFVSARALEEKRVELKKNEEIAIDSIIVSGNSTAYSLTINVVNNGSVVSEIKSWNLLIDGSQQSFSYSSPYLLPLENATLYVSSLSGAGIHRLKIVTEKGNAIYGSYEVV